MAASSSTIERTIRVIGTGPSAFPSRLPDVAGTLSSTYKKVIHNIIPVSTLSATTINFQGMTIARLAFMASDTKLKIRLNGNSPMGLGSTSGMAAAMMAMWEGSTTSMIVSNPSSAYIGSFEYILAGNI